MGTIMLDCFFFGGGEGGGGGGGEGGAGGGGWLLKQLVEWPASFGCCVCSACELFKSPTVMDLVWGSDGRVSKTWSHLGSSL